MARGGAPPSGPVSWISCADDAPAHADHAAATATAASARFTRGMRPRSSALGSPGMRHLPRGALGLSGGAPVDGAQVRAQGGDVVGDELGAHDAAADGGAA